MNCGELKEGISAYADGALGARERERVVSHLDACPHCRRDWREIERCRAALAANPPYRMPEALRSRLDAMLEEEIPGDAPGFWELLRSPRAGWAFAAAALLFAFASHLGPLGRPRKAVPLARLLTEHSNASRKSADIGRALLSAAPYDAAQQAASFE